MPLKPQRVSAFWPSRRWWVALAALLLVAAALRYTGYNFSLPYVDHPDEPNHAIAGRMWIDMGSAKAIGLQGYPPGIITVNYILLRLFHDPSTPPTSLLWAVRLLSITTTVGTMVTVALLAHFMSGPLGGLLAAAFYGVTTVLVEFSRYGIADNFVAFFSVMAVLLALIGTLLQHYGWTRWSIVAVMLAIVFKYQAGALLPLVLLLPLVRLPSLAAGERRALIRHTLENVGYLAVFFFWLVVIYPSSEASLAPNWAAREGIHGSLLQNVFANTTYLIEELALGTAWVPVAVGLAILLLWPSQSTPRRRIAVVAGLLAAGFWHGAISLYGEHAFRQFVGEASFIAALVGAGVAAWVWPLQRLVTALHMPSHIATAIANWAVVLITMIVLVPPLKASIDNAYEHTLHDRRNDLARYVDTSLPPGPYIADDDNDKTLNGAWGGYGGLNIFRHIANASVDAAPIEEWRERGAVYAIESYDRYHDYADSDAGRAILEETLLLKSYPPSEDFRGPSMVVLRLYPIQYETHQTLDPITLVGYDIDARTVAPGETVTFTLYWQTDAALDSEYAVYNHLTPLDDRSVIAQVDNVPLFDVRRPTQTWDDPDETFISRPFTLTIPEATPAGEYRLMTGFYRRSDGARLTNAAGQDYMLVTTIEVH